MGQLMNTIQGFARGQEIMVKMQEDMSQWANATNPPVPLVVETLTPPPQVDPSIHIGALEGVPHVNLHPPLLK